MPKGWQNDYVIPPSTHQLNDLPIALFLLTLPVGQRLVVSLLARLYLVDCWTSGRPVLVIRYVYHEGVFEFVATGPMVGGKL